jgi:hypothetical protein
MLKRDRIFGVMPDGERQLREDADGVLSGKPEPWARQDAYEGAEQFVLDGDRLTHTPTGSAFWLGDKDIVCCEPGRLNLQTGHDYKLEELKDQAWCIMAVQRKGG